MAYRRQVRLEPAGQPDRARIWHADSTDVIAKLQRVADSVTLARE